MIYYNLYTSLNSVHFKYILHFFLHKTLYYLLSKHNQIYVTYKILYYIDLCIL